MKTLFKLTVLIALLASVSTQISAQRMEEGTRLVQAGIGLGGWADYSSQTPILSASYMHGIKNDFLNGKLAVGGAIGYKSATYNSIYDYRWTYQYTFVSGRATWHPDFIQSDKWDAYAGLSLGMLFVNFDGTGDAYAVDVSGSTMVLAGVVGARYAINENWGAYAELGSNLGYLTLGVSYKL